MKKILITGANSYVGTSFEKWCLRYPGEYSVGTVDMKNNSWRNISFSEYDVVLHVAGIVHQSSKNKGMKALYYKINYDLALEVAQAAKKSGVKQFIFMSSMSVYDGKKDKVINRNTIPKPNNDYGNSKLLAEKSISRLQDEQFSIVILRPPMIYGKGARGNYIKLSKYVRKSSVFPDIDNERSMIHIDNLCEFIRLIIDDEENGIFFPQNKEYVNTSELVKNIAAVHSGKIKLIKLFNPVIYFLRNHMTVVNKLFGTLVYEKSLSSYNKDYRIRTFEESIMLTESENSDFEKNIDFIKP